MYKLIEYKPTQEPWNKGKLTGQKPPFKPQQIWAIRVRLQFDNKLRDLAMFNLAIDSKLRGCDLVKLRVSDITQEAAEYNLAHKLFSRKHNDPFNLKSQIKRVNRSKHGSPKPVSIHPVIYSPAELKDRRTFRHDNTHGSFDDGFLQLD